VRVPKKKIKGLSGPIHFLGSETSFAKHLEKFPSYGKGEKIRKNKKSIIYFFQLKK